MATTSNNRADSLSTRRTADIPDAASRAAETAGSAETSGGHGSPPSPNGPPPSNGTPKGTPGRSGRFLGRTGHGPKPVLARYGVLQEEPLFKGGMGAIWLGEDEHGSAVAIKVPQPGEFREQCFEHERRFVAGLKHESIVEFREAGIEQTEAGPRPYFVMEYLNDTKPITKYAAAKKLPLRERLELMLKVCAAVGYLHREKRAVHRDLTTNNIRVDKAGQLKLIDFGLVSTLDPAKAPVQRAGEWGAELGTREYMSPEQFGGNPDGVDARSDIYSVGVVMYELITGELPYSPDLMRTREQLKLAVQRNHIRPSSRVARRMVEHNKGNGETCLCAGDLERIVMKALAGVPEHRFQSIDGGPAGEDLAANIGALLASRPLPMLGESRPRELLQAGRRAARTPLGRLVGLLLAIMLLAWAAWWTGRVLPTVWPGLNPWWERSLAPLHPTVTPGSFKSVQMIALGENEDLNKLATLAGVEPGATPDETIRRLDAVAARNVAEAKASVLVFDKRFQTTTTEADDLFIRAVKAARDEHKVPIVADTGAWESQHGPDGSERITAELVHSMAIIDMAPEQLWMTILAVERPGGDATPSMPLAAYAALQGLGDDSWLSIDERKHEIAMGKTMAGTPRASGERGRVRVTGTQRFPEPVPEFGFEPGDIAALYTLDIPPTAVLRANTSSYEWLFTAPFSERCARLGGKAVVIGNARDDADARQLYPDGRAEPVFGYEGVATTIDQLQRGRPITAIGEQAAIGNAVGWTIVGLCLAWAMQRAHRFAKSQKPGRAWLGIGSRHDASLGGRWVAAGLMMLALGVIAAAAVISCRLAFSRFDHLASPALAIVAGGLGVAGFWVLHSAVRARAWEKE